MPLMRPGGAALRLSGPDRLGLPAAPWLRASGARATAILVALGCAALTLLISVSPVLRLAYRAPQLRLVLETAIALVALGAAYLAVGRLRQTRALSDLFLVAALGLKAFSTFGIGRAAVSLPLVGAVVSAAVLVAAAFTPPRPLELPVRAAVVLCGALGAAVAALVVLSTRWVASDDAVSPRLSVHPQLDSRPGAVAAQLVCAVLLAIAAAGFAARADRSGDELLRWFALAAVIASFARIHYALFPALHHDWVYTGDVLRLVACLLVLTGCAREISSYWASRAELARAEERARLAREFHDGLAQELAFIVSETRRSAAADARALSRIRDAAERGLDETRWAIAALTRPVDEPLARTLAGALEETAARSGARIVVDASSAERALGRLDGGSSGHELIRIVREAATNAVRHGRAQTLTLSLVAEDERLRVLLVDDGCGFDPAAASRGFGLRSMDERAARLGGRIVVRSAPGAGAAVELEVPWHGRRAS
jgi:signal transduction histidine kinase